ncbi:MAG: PTS sugar transporter subunit IIB [Lachnospiraceae bacterium]|nr:PTS sugar transporter subunit IIB [Lachnospiraceae bacterium]MCR5777760.1 PTS sugar transporter subunit IIB [Lachnospiraceae bacterium]
MKNIVLFCAAGMSTSLLVKKMQTAAESENYECNIAAYSYADLMSKGPDADIILLGPQVRFNEKKTKDAFPEKPVMVIPMTMYGRMDGKGVMGEVQKLI